MSCYVVMLVRREDCSYFLPDCYRNISLYWLQHQFGNQNYLQTVAMLRLMKYFDYTETQKGLLLGIVDGAILG
jgi:hypothetical protein